ncbi:hypothetical protein RINTHH_910 [Richelia intracellularis HH01]|jgi:hypothetical protein|uniref:Peptidoglycan binding-like domain-containing protein n=1 Tax=Richelia intracellularis HH01 TaxID=1165094 RepID=M1X4J2_9NOST|nr:hypothetical protein [Richelia intracellularis]CCH66246.1 hypothetical protein RINTHH_910 [Richelia intracellularis HH01]
MLPTAKNPTNSKFLFHGVKGKEVSFLQQKITSVFNNYGNTYGIFGPITKKVVKQCQAN